MKIVMVYPNPNSEKGISSYSERLIRSIEKQGLKIDKCTFLQGDPFNIFTKIWTLLRYDVIHIQHEYNLMGGFGISYFPFLGILRMLGKKNIVVTMHTVLSQNEKFRSGRLKTFLRKILYKLQNRWIKFTSSKIIVHSKAFKNILINEYGVPDGKITVFPHAILEDVKITPKSKAKKRLMLSGNVYLMIGTMMPDHGHDIVIKEARKIGKTILVAATIGVVNYRNEERIRAFLKLNENLVKENHLEKYVRFDLSRKPFSKDKWWLYLSAADLVLLPYRGGIGSGIFADAMAVKRPVVASNIPYFKEFAKDYGCISIAKTDKDFPRAIKESMQPRNYRKMEDEVRKYVHENGYTPISKKYKKFYLSLA